MRYRGPRALNLGAPVDRGHPLAYGLAGCWFGMPNNGGSSTLFDAVGGNHATLATTGSGIPTWAGSPGGLRAVKYDGSDDYADVPHVSALTPTAVTTFAAWVRLDAAPGSGQLYIGNLWSNETAGSNYTIWRIGSRGSGTYAQRVGINFWNGSDHDAENNTDLPIGAWTHVVVTTDGTNARWYLNGSLDTTVSYTFTPTTMSNTWRFGARFGGSSADFRPFNGALADVLYYPSRAVTDVASLYAEAVAGWPTLLRRVSPVSWFVGTGGGGGGGSAVPVFMSHYRQQGICG